MTYRKPTQTQDDDNVNDEASSLLAIGTASPSSSSCSFGPGGGVPARTKKTGVPMRAVIATCFLLGTIAVIYGGNSSSNSSIRAVGSSDALLLRQNQAAPLYDSNTDYCFKSKTADQYCWYPTDSFPDGRWKGVGGHGDNNCGPTCTSVNDDDDGDRSDDLGLPV